MEVQIFIQKNGQQYGPYNIDQVNEYLAQGSLSAVDPAWHEELAEWCPLNQIAGVVDGNSPMPPAFDPNTFSPNPTPLPVIGAHQVEPPVIGVVVVPPVAANPPPEFVEYESYEPKPTGRWHKRPAVYVFAVLNILYGITYGLVGLGILFQWLSAFDDLAWWGHLVGIVYIYFFGIHNGIEILFAAGGQLFASANPDDKSDHFRKNGELAESWGVYFGIQCFLIVIIWLFVSMAIPWLAVIGWAIWVGINFGYHALADSFLENPFRQK